MTESAPVSPTTFLVPVGHDIGPYLPEPDSDQYRFQVRLGSRIVEPDFLEFAIWLLAHDSEHGLPDRTDVIEAAVNLGFQRAQILAVVDTLLAEGLLVRIEPESARAFAETHQLLPLMVGLGPDATDPTARVVGLLDMPVVQMTTPMYDLWIWAHLRPNLWLACDDAAAAARDAGSTEPAEVEPEQVVSELLSAVHPLLAARTAYLDVRQARANERTVAA